MPGPANRGPKVAIGGGSQSWVLQFSVSRRRRAANRFRLIAAATRWAWIRIFMKRQRAARSRLWLFHHSRLRHDRDAGHTDIAHERPAHATRRDNGRWSERCDGRDFGVRQALSRRQLSMPRWCRPGRMACASALEIPANVTLVALPAHSTEPQSGRASLALSARTLLGHPRLPRSKRHHRCRLPGLEHRRGRR